MASRRTSTSAGMNDFYDVFILVQQLHKQRGGGKFPRNDNSGTYFLLAEVEAPSPHRSDAMCCTAVLDCLPALADGEMRFIGTICWVSYSYPLLMPLQNKVQSEVMRVRV